jgi:hypothetical protein
MKEQWKVVAGYEGFYEVSDLGRVRSVPHEVAGRCCTRITKGKIRRQQTIRGNYKRVSLCLHNSNRLWLIHVLVARAFVPNPLGLPEVNHKKGKGNAATNLEWRTKRGNTLHAVQNSLYGADAGITRIKKSGKYRARYAPAPMKREHLGCFNTYEEAKAARAAAISQLENVL